MSQIKEENIQRRKYQNITAPSWNLMDILHVINKNILLIIICTIVGLIVGIVMTVILYMRGEMQKEYAITTSIAVIAKNTEGLYSNDNLDPSLNDILLAEQIVDAVEYIIRSDKTLNTMVDHLELIGISTKDIADNLTISQYEETQIIEITLYWRSADEGVKILDALNDVIPSVLKSVLWIGDVSVINEPKAKYLIGGRFNASVWLSATMLGLAFGLMISLMGMKIKPTIMNPIQMETLFDVELLAEISDRKEFFKKKRNLLITNIDDALYNDVIDNFLSMAYVVKHRLSILDIEHPCVYITSAVQGEGKTIVCAHLAVKLAEIGMKVLAIDLDTRNPKLGGLFLNKVEYDHSLNALYRGNCTKEDAITNLTGNLDLLPSVLEQKRLQFDILLMDMIGDLKKEYDIILLDTDPVGQVASTMSLNLLADVALMVVRFDSTGISHIRESLVRLDKSGMLLLGCVVNAVKVFYNSPMELLSRRSSAKQPHKVREKTELEEEWSRWEKEREQRGSGFLQSDQVEGDDMNRVVSDDSNEGDDMGQVVSDDLDEGDEMSRVVGDDLDKGDVMSQVASDDLDDDIGNNMEDSFGDNIDNDESEEKQ